MRELLSRIPGRAAAAMPAALLAALLIGAAISGCTLSGAEPAPLTPVAAVTLPATQEPTEQLPPTPTEAGPIDVFGTQTAQAPTPAPSEEPPAEPTGEPSIATPTPQVPGTQEPAEGGSADCPATHTVQQGENLFRIALKYGLTTEELAAANGIANPASIVVGTVLRIPGCGAAEEASPGEAAAAGTHTVQAGENLYRIALKYGLSWQELAEFNGITNPNTLVVGQVLRIPGN